MKIKFNYNVLIVLILINISLELISCSDWTKVKSVGIINNSIKNQDPKLYAKYLKSLREYKRSDHKVAYVTFDNSCKKTFSRSQHINSIPDSVDIVSLKQPDKLAQWELLEIEEMRKDKGTKFTFTIDFDIIKAEYKKKLDGARKSKDSKNTIPDFAKYLGDTLKVATKLVDKYKYDGICFAYKGKSTLHMTIKEKEEYNENQKVFVDCAKDWKKEVGDSKIMLFEGSPQYILNTGFLSSCKYIIIPCFHTNYRADVTYEFFRVVGKGIPNDRYIVGVSSISQNPTDTKTGYWESGTKRIRAIEGVADWLISKHIDYSLVGIGIYNINSDYFSEEKVYHFTKKAINKINPSFKK